MPQAQEEKPKSAIPERVNQLRTITLDTYKASLVNSLISSLRMRIEPIESYISECQRKEAMERKQQLAEQKEAKKRKINEKKSQAK
jgi:predicted lipase